MGSRRSRPLSARLLAGLLALALAAAGAACDDSFTPILPNAQRLSVWGYLEVTRDTQWIRIGALRPTLLTSGDSLPVQATLEDLTTGQIIHLQQATVRWNVVAPVDSAATTVHNFWTTVPIRPGASFRFRARGDIADAVEAVVRVPADFRMDVLLAQAWDYNPDETPSSDFLELIGLHYVAAVTATTIKVDSCGNATQIDYLFPVLSDSLHDPHTTPMVRPTAKVRGCGPSYVIRRTLSVVGSGSAWPQASDALGDVGPGNITNGVGFLGGTLTRTIPYENCAYVSSTGSNRHCRLHYDSSTVTLMGRVWDPMCAEPVARALVTLQELDPRAPDVARIRSIYTDFDGHFWMSALEPGMHYAMTVYRSELPANWGGGSFQEFQDYHATVVFTPGQQATHDLDLLGRSYAFCLLGP